MNRPTVALAAIALAGGLASPALADRTTPQYTSLTVFGDSLVDAGNIFTLTGGTTPSAAQGYFQGRFTNGYDYTDLLSIDLFGTPTVASLRGGDNYAFGGARASTTSGVPDLNEQLALYSADVLGGKAVDGNGLYILNFGGNDVFNAPPPGVAEDAFLMNSAMVYAQGVQTLNNLGVRNLLITGFPVLTDPASARAEGFLTDALAGLTLDPSTTLYRFSYLDFFGRVLSDPGSLGLPPAGNPGNMPAGRRGGDRERVRRLLLLRRYPSHRTDPAGLVRRHGPAVQPDRKHSRTAGMGDADSGLHDDRCRDAAAAPGDLPLRLISHRAASRATSARHRS